MTLTFDLTFSRKGGQSQCKWFRIPTISCFLYLNFLWYLKKTTFDVFSDLKCETFRLSEIWNNFQTDSDFLANASRFRNVRCFVTEGRMTLHPDALLSFSVCRGSKISLCLRKKNKNKNGYKQNKIKRPSKLYLAMFQLFGINMQTFWHFYSADWKVC